MKHILIIFSLFLTFTSVAFEGIIHCTKIQDGVTTRFHFFVRGNQIAIVSDTPEGNYKVLVSSNRQEVKICMDSPLFEEKGYYSILKDEVEKNQIPKIQRQTKTDALMIDGFNCEGYTLVSDIGTAIAYIGPENINLSGLSAFFNDPLYELLDAFKIEKLPRKIVVNKTTGSYTIDLTAEETRLDPSVFEVPQGMKQFQVTLE